MMDGEKWNMEHTRWFKDKVFYQIWPRSFRDGNGDGIGDLWGVLEKLDYLQELGIDGVWFSPLYPSPGADCGYDISDYMDIAPEYGGMEAFRAVLDGLHQRGMKLIMDLVVNHTSDEHEWFQKSRRRIEPYTDYYIWRPAKKNGKLPNNWDSHFEGKAWQWDDLRQEYYLHLFAVKQPDLNMDNPLVRTEVKKILKFWLDLGVDGFREDVITFISKKEGLPDDHLFPVFKGIRFYNHGPHIHEYLQEFRRDVLANYDCMTIAEAPLVTPQRALDYIAESDTNEIDMMIQFQCMCADCFFTDYMPRKFSLNRLRRACDDWKKETNIGFARADGARRARVERAVSGKPRPSPRHLALRQRTVPRGERQDAGGQLSVFKGHAVRLSGAGDRHDELVSGQNEPL